MQEFASLIVTVCEPAAKPVVEAEAPKLPPSKEKLYVGAPPVTPVTVEVPFALPQVELLVVTVADVGLGVVPILNVVVNKHPLMSLTVTECVPAAKPEVKLAVATASTLKLYAGVPPVTPVTL